MTWQDAYDLTLTAFALSAASRLARIGNWCLYGLTRVFVYLRTFSTPAVWELGETWGSFDTPPMVCHYLSIHTYGLFLTDFELFSWSQKRFRASAHPLRIRWQMPLKSSRFVEPLTHSLVVGKLMPVFLQSTCITLIMPRDSRSNCSRDIRLPHFVTDERRTTPADGTCSNRAKRRLVAFCLNKRPTN